MGQVATYGGLNAGIEFEKSYGFSISGSSILGSDTYSNLFTDKKSISDLCTSNSHKWMNVLGKFARYKVTEVYSATGETRTRYFIAGNCLNLKSNFSTRTTGTTVNTTQRKILFEKNTVYPEGDAYSFSSSSDYSFGYNGEPITVTTTVTVGMKLSGGKKVTYKYHVPTAVNRQYTIGVNRIQVSN